LRLRATAAALLAVLAFAADAQDAPARSAPPSLEALEAAGAIIGEIRISADDVFNLDDPAENNWLFRFANRVHIQTRPEVIRNQLLFKSGEKLSAQRVQESERLLRGNRYLYEAHIRPVAWRDGGRPGGGHATLVAERGHLGSGRNDQRRAQLREFNFLTARLGLRARSTQVTTAGGTRRCDFDEHRTPSTATPTRQSSQ
jgi:hypothetical protein